MTVPFLDVQAAYTELRGELCQAFVSCMESGSYILGQEVEAFEAEFAEFCGVDHCVGVGTGLDALHLLLRAAGVGEGDEVLVPAHTFIATWLAVSHTGARPVPVEPDPHTWNLDPAALRDAIGPKTRAVVAVHLYGQPANMEAITRVAREHGLLVFEDAAQAHGARHHGARAGGLSDGAAFSFYPGKNLGAFGDGGAVTTPDEALAERVRMLRNYGSTEKYVHECRGFNSRLDELQAALLRVRLTVLDSWNQRRQKIADFYRTNLGGCPDLELQHVPQHVEPVWHLFVVRSPRRDELKEHLAKQGIGTLVHYPTPPHRAEAYEDLVSSLPELPLTEELADSLLSLPIGPHLGLAGAERVVSAVHDFLEN